MAATATKTVMKPETISNEAFNFPQGLAGFGEAHEFGFIYEGYGDIVCLQSLDSPEAAFLITPWDEERLGPVPKLPNEQCSCINTQAQNQIMWMLVLNPFSDKQWVTANLRAPIALNMVARLGLQFIRADSELEVRYRWMKQPS